jgi:hypothetical protein
MKKFFNWLFGVVKKLFKIAMDGVRDEVTDILNNEEFQYAAKQAIFAVMDKGFKDNEALDAAVEILKEKGIAAGMEAGNTILKTLVQNAFCAIKCQE